VGSVIPDCEHDVFIGCWNKDNEGNSRVNRFFTDIADIESLMDQPVYRGKIDVNRRTKCQDQTDLLFIV
jgi:hypothetical protein